MALATYSDLKTSLANWLIKSNLTAVIPDFITLCEKEVDARTLLRLNEATATLTLTSSVAALPSDFKAVRTVFSSSDPSYPVQYMAPDQLTAYYTGGADGCIEKFYTIEGSVFRMGTTTDETVTLNYYATLPVLSESNTTNFLLTKFPNIYLYGSLKHAAPYLGKDERVAVWARLFEEGMAALELYNFNSTYGNSSLTIRPREVL